jgi:hypothetical protein
MSSGHNSGGAVNSANWRLKPKSLGTFPATMQLRQHAFLARLLALCARDELADEETERSHLVGCHGELMAAFETHAPVTRTQLIDVSDRDFHGYLAGSTPRIL